MLLTTRVTSGAAYIAVLGLVAAGGMLSQVYPVLAETVEVAPGVKVTKKSFSAPPNEQPFYGFIEKNAAMREGDEGFAADAFKIAGTREKAFEQVTARGWRAISSGNFSEASKRFNQAFLLAPEQSQIYHGLAIVVAARFNDLEFSEELFKIARKQPAPLPAVNADYGRLLLMAKRPRDAQPVLEQAVKDVPKFASAWSNLGVARVYNGDPRGACTAAEEAAKFADTENVNFDLAWIKREAHC